MDSTVTNICVNVRGNIFKHWKGKFSEVHIVPPTAKGSLGVAQSCYCGTFLSRKGGFMEEWKWRLIFHGEWDITPFGGMEERHMEKWKRENDKPTIVCIHPELSLVIQSKHMQNMYLDLATPESERIGIVSEILLIKNIPYG